MMVSNMRNIPIKICLRNICKFALLTVFLSVVYIVFAHVSLAASLSLSPGTGVYTSGTTFAVNVRVNTQGKEINAAEGSIKFNPNEITVVSVNRSASIFNLWVTEPKFSNSAGTISFSGGSPSGYSGSGGTVMSVVFRASAAGTPRVSFTNGSVLANDGRGTNVLTAMNGGSFTIQAQSSAPAPEVITEYVAPANTPAAPMVTSNTHSEPAQWHASNEATLSWNLPVGITAVRTGLNSNPTSVPTKVYEDPIRTITLSDLDEGVSYFHIQFQNEDGWGKVAHYRLAVDTQKPTTVEISQPKDANLANPTQELIVYAQDDTSEVNRFIIKIDNQDAIETERETASGTLTLPPLNPGYHSIIIEAFDEAGNSIIASYSLTILSFDKPVFTEYPSEINEEVIPVITGLTRPDSTVEVLVKKVGGEPTIYTVESDENGSFTFIPEGTFSTGVYELSARATDEFGAQSDLSEVIKIAVQQPGYLQIGSYIISVLSVIVPLAVMVGALVLGVVYLITYFRRFKKKVGAESVEALEILRREFTDLQKKLHAEEESMQMSRKTKKLTKAESHMIQTLSAALMTSQKKVEKEIEDISNLTKTHKK
jgi:hypothetical protein